MKRGKIRYLLSLLPFLLLASVLAAEIEKEEITIDLQSPSYAEGCLSTEAGGLVAAPGLRIQARKIRYFKSDDRESIEAEGDLQVEFGEFVLVGERIIFDFLTKSGLLFYGRAMSEPWFIGGEIIYLLPDGSYQFEKAYVTTSENLCPEWGITSSSAKLTDLHLLKAENVHLQFLHTQLFWIPRLNLNFDTIFDSPIRYTIRTGNVEGPRIGFRYEFYSDDYWKSFAIFDYRFRRGVGGGLETKYRAPDRETRFHMINYVARDKTLIDPTKRTRYRFQGVFEKDNLTDRSEVQISYDLLSDQEMPTDYSDCGLQEEVATPTQFHLRHEEKDWLVNFLVCTRLNIFQSVKQELPTLQFNYRPFNLGNTQFIGDAQLRASYLDYVYTKNQYNPADYHSLRYEFTPRLWHPFHYHGFHLTPEAGGVFIYYSGSPEEIPRWTVVAKLKCDLSCDLYRYWNGLKHLLTPYCIYTYFTDPTTNPNDQYIFDINDGWYQVNQLRFGVRQNLYGSNQNGDLYRYLFADFWTDAFFGSTKLPTTIYKTYGKIIFQQTARLRHTFEGGWDFAHHRVDHSNWQVQWTVDNGTALSLEYLHRSPYDWRKVDRENFILDLFQSEESLLHSSLSDRRDILQIHLYHQYSRNWALELLSRSGWNRTKKKYDKQPSFSEYEINLLGTIRSTWYVTLTFRHRVDDNRFFCNFNIGLNRPRIGAPPIPVTLEL